MARKYAGGVEYTNSGLPLTINTPEVPPQKKEVSPSHTKYLLRLKSEAKQYKEKLTIPKNEIEFLQLIISRENMPKHVSSNTNEQRRIEELEQMVLAISSELKSEAKQYKETITILKNENEFLQLIISRYRGKLNELDIAIQDNKTYYLKELEDVNRERNRLQSQIEIYLEPTVEQLRTELKGAQASALKCEQEAGVLSFRNDELRCDNEKKQQFIYRLQTEVEGKIKEINSMNESRERSLKREFDESNQMIVHAQTADGEAEEDMKQAVEALKAEKEMLQSSFKDRLKKLETKYEYEMKQLRAQSEKVNLQQAQLTEEQKSSHQTALNKYQDEIYSLKAELKECEDRLEKANKDFQGAFDDLKGKHTKYITGIKSAYEEQLLETITRCQADYSDLQSEHSNNLRDLFHCEYEKDQLKKQLKQDKEDHADQKDQLTTSYKAELDQVVVRYETTVSSLKFEIDALRHEVMEEKRDKEKTAAQLKRTITEREQLAVKYNQDLKQEKLRLETKISNMKEKVILEKEKDLIQLRTKHKRDLRALKSSYKEAQWTAADSHTIRLENELTETKAALEEVAEDKDMLLRKIDQLDKEHAADVQRMQDAHKQDLQDEKNKYEQDVEKLRENLEDKVSGINFLEQEKEKYLNQFKSEKYRADSQEAELIQLRQQMSEHRLENEVRKTKAELKEVFEDKDMLLRKIDKLDKKHAADVRRMQDAHKQDLQEEKNKYEQDVENLRKNLEDKVSKISFLEQEKEKALNQFQSEKYSQEAELSQLRQQLSEQRHGSQLSASSHENVKQSLGRNVEKELTKTKAAWKEVSKEKDMLLRKIDKLVDEHTADIQRMQDAHKQDLQEGRNKWKQEEAELKHRLTETQSEVQDHSNLLIRLEQATEGNNAAVEKLERQQKDISYLKSECGKLKQDLSDAEQSNNINQNIISQVRDEKAAEKNTLDIEHAKELRRLKQQHDKEISRLNDELDAKQRYISIIHKTYEQELHQHESQQMKTVESDYNTKLEKEEDKHKKEMARLKSECSISREELRRVEAAKERIQSELTHAQKDHITERNALVHAHSDEMKNMKEQHEAVVWKLKTDHTVKQSDLAKKYEHQVTSLRSEYMKEMEGLKDDNKLVLAGETAKCEREIARLEEALKDKKTVIAQMHQENEETFNKFEQLTQDYQHLQNVNDKCKKEISRLQSEYSKARERLSKAEGDKENLQSERTQMLETQAIERNKLVVTHSDEMKKMREHHESEVKKLKTDHAVKQSDLAKDYEHQVNRLRSENIKEMEGLKDGQEHVLADKEARYEKEIARLERALQDGKTHVTLMDQERKEALKTLKKLKTENTKLKQLTRDYQHLQNANDKQQKEVERLKSEYSKAKKEAEEATQNAEYQIKQAQVTHTAERDQLVAKHDEELRKIKQQHKTDLQTLKEDHDKTEDKCYEYQQEIATLKSKHSQKIQKLKGDMLDAENEHQIKTSRLQLECDTLREKLTYADKATGRTTDDLKQVKQTFEYEMNMLITKQEELKKMNIRYEQDVEKLKKHLKEKVADIRLLTQEKGEALYQLQSEKNRSDGQEAELNRLRQQVSEQRYGSQQSAGSHDQEKQSLERKIKQKEAEINKLTLQLSKYMNQRLGEDESALENINAKNRPSKIVEDYNELMTSQWLDAKDQLDEIESDDRMEESKLACLCNIVTVAGEVAVDVLNRHRAYIQWILTNPLSYMGATRAHGSLVEFDENKLGSDLKSSLNNILKVCTEQVEVQVLEQELNLRIKHDRLLSRVYQSDGLKQYIQASCIIAWRMATQRPPITFECPGLGEPVDTNLHEVYFSCPKNKTNVVSTYVYPLLKQKGKSLLKAKVFVVPKARCHPKC